MSEEEFVKKNIKVAGHRFKVTVIRVKKVKGK